MSQHSLTAKFGAKCLQFIESIISLGTTYPDSAFYGHDDLPWLKELEKHSPSIELEGALVLEQYKQLMNLGDLSQYQNEIDESEGWKVFFLTGYGYTTKSAMTLCPNTLSALNSVPNISSAIFSILAPGKQISLHRGMYKGLGRVHLAVKVPDANQDCWIEVNQSRRAWVKGEAFGFEDAFYHKVQNNTDEYRIVLLVTFERPMTGILSLLNKVILNAVKKTKYVRETKSRYENWEKINLSTISKSKNQ